MMAYLARAADLRPVIADGGAVEPLIRLLSYKHDGIQTHAAGCIANLVLHKRVSAMFAGTV